MLPSTHHIAFTPLPRALPLLNSNQIILSHSGLDAAEETWIKRLLRALGITHASTFSRACTHLLCPSRQGVKFDKAGEWGVPVVDMSWLENIVQTGVIPQQEQQAAKPLAREGKGKGKKKTSDQETGLKPSKDELKGLSREEKRMLRMKYANPLKYEETMLRKELGRKLSWVRLLLLHRCLHVRG